MKLSVIIVSHNVKYFLEHCLRSVGKACKNIEAEVFVVDNASSDGSRDFFRGRFQQVRFIWNEENIGFSRANNQALKEAKGEQVLFLNPDTIVPEDCFEKCIGYFSTHADCGALGVRMIDGSGSFLKESKRSFPSPMTSFFKMTGLCQLFPHSKTFAAYYAGHIDDRQTASVEVLSGAFMMVSRKIISRVAGFDEQFFMYGEDIDLSYRMKKTGFKNIFFADTTIIHFKGESTQKESPSYTEHFYGAMNIFVKKHYSEQKITLYTMRAAIGISKWLSGIKRKMSGKASIGKKLSPPYSLLIVAGQEKFNEMIQQLKFAPMPVVICGRLKTGASDSAPGNGFVEQSPEVLKRENADAILFCENDISYFDIIEQFQLLHRKAKFLIHSLHCKAIIGSDNKNKAGFAIVEKESDAS